MCAKKICQLYEICFGMVSLFFKIVLYFWKDSINAIIKLSHPERSRRKFPQWNGGVSLTFKRQKECVARVSTPWKGTFRLMLFVEIISISALRYPSGGARSVHLLKRRNYRYLFSRKSKMICATKWNFNCTSLTSRNDTIVQRALPRRFLHALCLVEMT